MRRTNISADEKVDAVQEYLSGQDSQSGMARSLGITKASFQEWIRNYENMGEEAFTVANTKKYSAELKAMAVQEYLSGLGSLDDICKKYGILSKTALRKWIKWYNDHGDFKQPKGGGIIYMVKGRNTTLEERIEIVSYCIANNKDYGKTIEQYGVSYQQLYGWIRKYEKDGSNGLTDRRGKRKDEFSMSEVEKLRAQLKLKEAENLRLQMENELLKKLEALERGQRKDLA